MQPTEQTPEQRQATIAAAGQQPAAPQQAPTAPAANPIPSVLQPADLGPSATPVFPKTPNLAIPDISGLSIDQQAQNYAQQQLPTTPTATETENATLKSKFLKAYETISGKPAAQLAAEQQANVPQYAQQLNDINNQIRQLQVQNIKDQEKASQTGETLGFAAGETQRVAHNNAIQAMSLAATAQAMQGNLATAQSMADRAVATQFAPAQAELDYLKQALDLNYQDLSREDKKKADQQQIFLGERQRLLDAQKQDVSDVHTVAMQAAQNGADSTTINRILKAKDATAALSIAGSTLGAKFRLDQANQKLDNQYKQAQIDKIYADIHPGNTATTITADNLVQALGSNKISAATKTNVGNILGVINSAEDLAKSNPTGSFSGYYPGAAVVDFFTPKGFKRDATIKNEGNIDAINLRVQQWASGASLTKQQIDQVNKLVPSKNDSDRTFQTKLNNLVNVMQGYIKGSLQSEGIDYTPETVDLFHQNQSLEDIFSSGTTMPGSTPIIKK